MFRMVPWIAAVAEAIEWLLSTTVVQLQSEAAVAIATGAVRSGRGAFTDALIAALAAEAGCSAT